MRKIYTRCVVCKTSHSPECKTLVTWYIPWARTWSEVAMKRVEIILSLNWNSHNPSSSPKPIFFSPVQLRASFPGVWSRLRTILCKPLHRLFFCVKSSSMALSFKTAHNSSRPYCFISLIALRHPSSPPDASHIPALASYSPRVPGAQTISFELIWNPTTTPPHSDLHVRILAELFRPNGDL